MAGGGGSTGGIGAQSPAVNPPSPMGQISNQIGNIAGSAFGGAQQPIPQDTSSMGGNVDMGMGYAPGMQQTGYNPNLAAMFGGPNGQQYPNMLGGDGFTPDFGQQPFMAQAPQQLGGQPNPFVMQAEQQQMAQMPQVSPMSPDMQQANAQRAFEQTQGGMGQQPAGIAGLTALLQGMPNQTAQPRPAPAMAPNPGKPAPVAAKPAAAKPSMVPPKTPPAVASAIQKLAAKKQAKRR